jgi:hypothetical protein
MQPWTLPVQESSSFVAREQLRLIEMICARPDMRLLCAGLRFDRDSQLDVPFRVLSETHVLLAPSVLTNSAVAVLHMRFAAELVMLGRLGGPSPGPEARMARALLALKATVFLWQQMTEAERAACAAESAGWLHPGLRLVSGAALASCNTVLAAAIARDLRPILALELGTGEGIASIKFDSARLSKCVRNLFTRVGELAAPTEAILLQGADDRLLLDPASGRNGYGVSSRPQPQALAFASSTASSISVAAYDALEGLRQSLIMDALRGRHTGRLRRERDQIRSRVLEFCGLDARSGATAILTPSGTDTEYYALWLASAGGTKEIVNIVIAPDETGSGVIHAAAGRNFSTCSPWLKVVKKGEPVEGFSTGQTRVANVAVRDQEGRPRTIAALDAEVAALVQGVVEGGAHCLVHLLDCSKTGLGGPSLSVLRTLRARYDAALDVVVDACQMRVGRAALRHYLDEGFMVALTGSKFLAGPPFAGALVVPRAIARRTRSLPALPAGFAAYTCQADWPAEWRAIHRALPARNNVGLLFRWTAALVEYHAWDTLSAKAKDRAAEQFGSAVIQAIVESRSARLIEPAVFQRDVVEPQATWYQRPTIFPFVVFRPQKGIAGIPLDLLEARRIHRWLNMDIADLLPQSARDDERRIAKVECHIGQPVKLGWPGGITVGALRISLDARIMVRLAAGGGAIDAPTTRSELGAPRFVLAKVDLIAKYFDHLSAGQPESA